MDSVATPGSDPDGESARRVVSRVAKALGQSVLWWQPTTAEPTADGILSGYEIEFESAEGDRSRHRIFVETNPAETDTVRPGVMLLPAEGPDAALAAWIYPNDPALPALSSLVDASRASETLAMMGLDVEVTATTVIAYRPGARAVLRVEGASADGARDSLYAKVVEPGRAAALAERHELFRSSGVPVPRALGWSQDGIVAMTELEGTPAHTALPLIRDPEGFLDQIEFLIALIAGIPAINTARTSLLERVDWYVERLVESTPAEEGRIRDLGALITSCRERAREFAPDPVTVHGDLHLGQLFVDGEDFGSIVGVLDIDTAGSGDPADDAAALYAHLVALAVMAEPIDASYATAGFGIAERWIARWPRNRNPGFDLRARAIAATHLLGHTMHPMVTDAGVVRERLLEFAEALVARA
jgi:aminoglycoside phosphotransferase (APT) family kinase protein